MTNDETMIPNCSTTLYFDTASIRLIRKLNLTHLSQEKLKIRLSSVIVEL